MRTIALEEHFATHAYLDGPAHRLKEQAAGVGGRFAALIDQLVDIADGRVAAMDAAGVDVQALSLTAPGVEQLDVEEAKTFARSTNVARGRDPKPSDAVFRPGGAADRRSAGRRRGARASGRQARVQRRHYQWPSSRTLSRQPFLLAGLG